MADQKDTPGGSFDQVEEGPAPSEADSSTVTTPEGLERAHPTVKELHEEYGDAVVGHDVRSGDEHVVFLDPDRVLEVMEWLKNDPAQHYDLLRDLTAVDHGGGRPLQVVYQLFSLPHRRALRIICELPLSRLEIDSVVPLWKTANWFEREVFDLFGIDFEGHPDLRRILMPENYAEGHPLRKDFPLRGRFSRAEQTRRALSQDPHDHYIPEELAMGREPQMAEGAAPGRSELPEEPEENAPGGVDERA